MINLFIADASVEFTSYPSSAISKMPAFLEFPVATNVISYSLAIFLLLLSRDFLPKEVIFSPQSFSLFHSALLSFPPILLIFINIFSSYNCINSFKKDYTIHSEVYFLSIFSIILKLRLQIDCISKKCL